MVGHVVHRRAGSTRARADDRAPTDWPLPVVQRAASGDGQFDSLRFEAGDVAFVRSVGRTVRVQPRPRSGDSQDLHILLNHSGDCRATLAGDRAVQIPARSFLVVREREIRQFEMPGSFRHVVLKVAPERLSPRVEVAERVPNGLFCAARGYARAFFECASDVSPPSPPPSPADAGLMADAVLNLLALALKEIRVEQKCMENHVRRQQRARVLDYVRTHLHDPLLNIKRIAQALGMSTRYVHRLFEQEPLSLMEIVWRERTERCAEAMLAHPHKTISEVAFAFGFSDQAHFNHRFRAQFGLSPREYLVGMARRQRMPAR